MNDLPLFRHVPIAAPPPDGVPQEIAEMFERISLQIHAAGFTRYSARAVFHRMRWEEHIERGNREFKINNNDSAKLSRWFMERHPALSGFFETRESGA